MERKTQIVMNDVGLGIKTLVDMIVEGAKAKDGTFVVSLAGGSGSGKSTLTEAAVTKLVSLGYTKKAARKIMAQVFAKKEEFIMELQSRGLEVAFISADNYYKGGREVRKLQMENPSIGFDDPDAVDLELLRRDIMSLKSGFSILEKIYAFGDDPGKETGNLIDPPKILIVEGLFVLLPSMLDLANLTVFFDIGLHGWLLRRLLRDPGRTGQKPADILHYCATVVEPKYRQWILSTRKNADIVIVNEYNPQVEAKNTKKLERQIKFSVLETEGRLVEKLFEIGAENLTSTVQVDTYYNPHDRNLSETGESMRIRREPNRILWTYKGPKINGQDSGLNMVERAKYEFEISEATKQAFLAIYGKEIKVIKKVRTFFLIGSMVITVDSVKRIQSGIEEDMGVFLEFRMQSGKISSEKSTKRIEKILEKLSLKDAVADRRSYVEM